MKPMGVTHTGQPGPEISSTALRKELSYAKPENLVGVSAADLHYAKLLPSSRL